MKHLAIKVTNKHESEAVQKALFDMGFCWLDDLSQNIKSTDRVKNESIKFIVTHKISNKHKLIDNIFMCEIAKSYYEIISSSEFFSTYAGHIERFPDYAESKRKDRSDFFIGNAIQNGYIIQRIFSTEQEMIKSTKEVMELLKREFIKQQLDSEIKPKLKVGDYLRYVWKNEICRQEITGIKDNLK